MGLLTVNLKKLGQFIAVLGVQCNQDIKSHLSIQWVLKLADLESYSNTTTSQKALGCIGTWVLEGSCAQLQGSHPPESSGGKTILTNQNLEILRRVE
jgi:hypothetical protein